MLFILFEKSALVHCKGTAHDSLVTQVQVEPSWVCKRSYSSTSHARDAHPTEGVTPIATVKSRTEFTIRRGSLYAQIELPRAKMASPGESNESSSGNRASCVCRIAEVTTARSDDPLLHQWTNVAICVHPRKKVATEKISAILEQKGLDSDIGGASYILAQKVDLGVVRRAGRWRLVEVVGLRDTY